MRTPAGKVVAIADDGQQWVTPTGGGYLFAPGRSALSGLATSTAPGHEWRSQISAALDADPELMKRDEATEFE